MISEWFRYGFEVGFGVVQRERKDVLCLGISRCMDISFVHLLGSFYGEINTMKLATNFGNEGGKIYVPSTCN